nr:MAG TPA: hypothetical protein [Caudoviricetes sp.]
MQFLASSGRFLLSACEGFRRFFAERGIDFLRHARPLLTNAGLPARFFITRKKVCARDKKGFISR